MVALRKIPHKANPPKSKLAGFMMAHTREFCDKTSLHGLRYVTENGAHWLQSLIWASFIILGAVFCCILMLLIWNRFQSNPTITAVETINYPVSNIPFPSVTICNANKVHKSRMENLKKLVMSNSIPEERADNFFKALSALVALQRISENFTDIFEILRIRGYNAESIMLEIMQPCSEMFKRCTWMGDVIDCTLLFKTIKTDEGFCCSFNYQHTDEIFDGPNVPISEYKTSALHISGAGIHTGLSLVVDIKETEYVSATRIVPSVLVHIHDVWDFAEMKILSTLIEKGQLIQMPVDPSVIDTTNDVKSLHYTKRNCLFSEEASLAIGSYGYENCIIQCRMDAIVELCKCIPFYYNVKKYNETKKVRFCEIADSLCISQHQRKLYTLRSNEVNTLDNASSVGLTCNCLPTCDVFWYSYTSDVGHMAESLSNENMAEVAVIHIYFSEFSCIKYKQSNLITWDGLFASFGGIFGLCLGGSILSIVEIVYHFTLRLYMSFKSNNQVSGIKGKLETESKWRNFVLHNQSTHGSKGWKINDQVIRQKKNSFNHHKNYNNDIFMLTKVGKRQFEY